MEPLVPVRSRDLRGPAVWAARALPAARARPAAWARAPLRWGVATFVIALGFHFYFATRNWTCTFMPGHEFRQAQTAIIAHYIDRQNNFSLRYETPILGKPWVSLLLEVPVYQWSVVGLSRATGWSHLVAARTISLACFYLALPALYLLLGRLRLPGTHRLFVLSFVLLCPVYLFYSRAFLMESAVVMCCAWFLVGFVRAMDERRWRWVALATVAGTGAALMKSITYAVWLLPGAAYGLWILHTEWRARVGWRRLMVTAGWGATTVAVPLGTLRAWIAYTDPIKEAHASAFIFSSKNLSLGNWGLLDLGAIFSGSTWRTLLERWSEALMPPWLLLGLLVLGWVVARPARGRIAGLGAVFFGAQVLFPFAYAYQDYYFYACAVFLCGALGFIALGAAEARGASWPALVLFGVVGAGQLFTYGKIYREWQLAPGHGGYPYTAALAELTPPGSVIVVAGNDWAAMTPLYAERKALMIRNGLERNAPYLDRAFRELADEDVSAIVLRGALRGNTEILRRAAAQFGYRTDEPTFSDGDVDVYVRAIYEDGVKARLRVSKKYPSIQIRAPNNDTRVTRGAVDIPATTAKTAFSMVSPAPHRGYFQFGVDRTEVDGRVVLSAHPDSDLWIHAPASATTIEWEFGFVPDAYERDGDCTTGVEFVVTGELPDGRRREVFRRVLDPMARPEDRGRQTARIAYEPLAGEVLQFSTRPNGNLAYDWVYWARIAVR